MVMILNNLRYQKTLDLIIKKICIYVYKRTSEIEIGCIEPQYTSRLSFFFWLILNFINILYFIYVNYTSNNLSIHTDCQNKFLI